MTAFLNFALLIIGTTATLAAFGGKTWEEGSKPLVERINRRGWVSLTCLFLALVIGVIKERRTEEQDDAVRSQAAHEQTSLQKQLADAKHGLDIANTSLDGLRKLLSATEDRLTDAKLSLDDVRKNLKATRDEQNVGSAANLLSAFAISDQRVKEVSFYIPLTRQANKPESVRSAFLPRFSSAACSTLPTLHVILETPSKSAESIDYAAEDKASRSERFPEAPEKADGLFRVTSSYDTGTIDALNRVLGQKSFNGYVYIVAVHPAGHDDSAASLYSEVSQRGFTALTIKVTWPRPYNAPTPGTVIGDPSVQAIVIPRFGAAPSIPLYPRSCVREIASYFRKAFDKALISFTLEQKQHESLTYGLRALPPKIEANSCELSFEVFSTPFLASSDEFESILDVKRPDKPDHTNR